MGTTWVDLSTGGLSENHILVAEKAFFSASCSAAAFWEAGILPLNYARKRGFALHFAKLLQYNSDETDGNEAVQRARILPSVARRAKHANKRVPKLRFTTLRRTGWHVIFRDRTSGIPRKYRFGIEEKERQLEACLLYHAWVHEHLGGNLDRPHPTKPKLTVGNRPESLTLLNGERVHSRAETGDEP